MAVALTIGGGIWANQYVQAEEASTSTAVTQPSATTDAASGQMGGKGHRGGMGMMGGKHGGNLMLKSDELASLLGMTADELTEALKSGKSLAAIAGEKGVDVQKVIDLQVSAMSAELDARVADGKLTQAQADEVKAELVDKATKMVNGELGLKVGGKGMMGGKHLFMGQYDELARLLGLTADELTEALKSGKSLAAIAGEKGVDVQKVIDLQVSAMSAELDARVADGKLTQAQADEAKANLTDKITKMVNGEFVGKDGKGGMGMGMMGGKHGGKRGLKQESGTTGTDAAATAQ
jgi:lipoate-protein ligase A